jgi:hypothetical protein
VTWPSNDALLAAWHRLTEDPAAGGAFVTIALGPLVRQLVAWRPTADPDAVESVASDVILWLLKYPTKYDPTKSPLHAFLLLVARRKLLTALRSEGRHRIGKIPWDDVEFALAAQRDGIPHCLLIPVRLEERLDGFRHRPLAGHVERVRRPDVGEWAVQPVPDGVGDEPADVLPRAAGAGQEHRPGDGSSTARRWSSGRPSVHSRMATGTPKMAPAMAPIMVASLVAAVRHSPV